MGLLCSSRSVNAAKQALRKMELPVSERELDAVAKDFVERMELRNTAALEPDMLALFIDAKHIDIREGDRIRPACIYTAVGLARDGRKRVLSALPIAGHETLDGWKKLLRGLAERGLRRVMLIVQDDFSGLLPITQSLFPKADVQLCIVHLQRNAQTHLGKPDAELFITRLRSIKASWDRTTAEESFEELCDSLAKVAPTWIDMLRKKRSHYWHFIDYPVDVRPGFSTTNVVETINGQLERMRRNNGGYFQSEETLKLKLGITIDYLEQGRWKSPAGRTKGCLLQLNALFEKRFESDL
jgi:transposase-like protein